MPSTLSTKITYGGVKRRKRPLKPLKPLAKRPTWKVSSAPRGFSLQTTPTKTTIGIIKKDPDIEWNEESLSSYYANFSAWATRNRLQIKPTEFTLIRYNSWSECYVWSSFELSYTVKPHNDKYFGSFSCSGCAKSLAAGTTMCPDCLIFTNCSSCYVPGLRLHGVPGSSQRYCGRCAIECSKVSCKNLVSPEDKIKECVECSPRAACHVCSVVFPQKELSAHTNKDKSVSLCSKCKATYVCQGCGLAEISVVNKKLGKNTYQYCTACVDKFYDSERKKFEKWPDAEMPKSGSLMLPSLSNRPIRTISIETEFDGNGPEVAKALYKAGLIESPSKMPYSSQGTNKRLPCILKSDGSVSGGELVTYLIDLDNENHAAAVLRMTEVMRSCRELGSAKFSYKAGGHIHIDLHNYSIEDLWGLYTVFKYLEMPLYYLAGSGASYGHRSLQGSGYSNPPRGGPYGTKEAFAVGFRRSGRDGLNLNNFNGALQACICGAIATGDWKKCSCNLGKATAEWRLWNAEITPRILHSWLAVMQSITAFAQDHVVSERNFPYLSWETREFRGYETRTINKIKERLEWMHEHLPLTLDERDSLVYALKKSDLKGLGVKYLDGLLDIKNQANAAAKEKPRNPSSRKETKFSLKENTDNLVDENGESQSTPIPMNPNRFVPFPAPTRGFSNSWPEVFNNTIASYR